MNKGKEDIYGEVPDGSRTSDISGSTLSVFPQSDVVIAPVKVEHSRDEKKEKEQKSESSSRGFKEVLKILQKKLYVAFVLVFFCVSSNSVVLTNKYAYGTYKFPCIFLLTTIYSTLITLILMVGRHLWSSVFDHARFKWRNAYYCLPLMFVRNISYFATTRGVKYLPVSSYLVLRNLNIIVIAVGEVYLLGARVTGLMVLSFACIIGGSVISSMTVSQSDDIQGSALGYFWCIANCFLTAFLALYAKYVKKNTTLEKMDFVYYHNLLSIVPNMVLSANFDEWPRLLGEYSEGKLPNGKMFSFVGLFTVIVLNFLGIFMVNFSSYWCMSVVSSTTYGVTTALNKVPLAVIGLIFFADEEKNPLMSIAALSAAIFGGGCYTMARILINKQREREKERRRAANGQGGGEKV